MEGFVKIHRSLLSWQWYTDTPTKCLFIDLLLSANFADKKWKGIVIERGQLVTSIDHLSLSTGLTPKQIRRALDNLESTGEITTKRTNKFTLITICNYDNYQCADSDEGQTKGKQRADKWQTKCKQNANKGQTNGKQNEFVNDCEQIIYNDLEETKDTQRANKRQTKDKQKANKGQQRKNNKKERIYNINPLTPFEGDDDENDSPFPLTETQTPLNIEEEKKEKKSSAKRKEIDVEAQIADFPPMVQDTVRRWVKYKKEQHRFTYKSADTFAGFLKQLFTLADGDVETMSKIVEQSIGNGWQGIFELKQQNRIANGNNNQGSIAERLARIDECLIAQGVQLPR